MSSPNSVPPSSEQDTSSPATRLGAVSLKLPPFWPADPALWFAHIESQFATRGIVNQLTKFHYVVAALTPSEAAEVRDIIMSPPSPAPYDKIKEELVRRTSASEQRRLQQLLTSEELGDRKPSQLLRRMQQLLGDRSTSIDASILRELFLQRLPANVRMVLTSSADISVDALAELADKIMDITSPPVLNPISASASTEQSELARLRADIEKLTDRVMTSLHVCRSRSPSPVRPRSQHRQSIRCRSNSRAPDSSSSLCWYHQTFGDRARSCKQPCSFSGNALANN